jgi:hypothetical protein
MKAVDSMFCKEGRQRVACCVHAMCLSLVLRGYTTGALYCHQERASDRATDTRANTKRNNVRILQKTKLYLKRHPALLS